MAETRAASATERLAQYMVSARTASLPEAVRRKASHHILDTIAAMVSGTTLLPGTMALKYARLQGGGDEASVVGTSMMASATTAALINGMLAHADETDDSHAPSLTHPGCAVVPAALAMAEKNDRSGDDDSRGFDSHAVGGAFGAAVAAGASVPLDTLQCRYLLSYAAQQASGLPSYPLDSEHVEKAFTFGGVPARNGTTAATMVEAGFSGIADDLEGYGGFLSCFGGGQAKPEELASELGSRYEVMLTNIKKYCVGSPCQAPLDCLVNIMRDHRVTYADFASMVVYAPTGETQITRADQPMPSLNLRYLLTVTLLDGWLSFKASHDVERMQHPSVTEISRRIEIRADAGLLTKESPRQGIVELVTRDGRTLKDHVVKVRGVMENPMSTDEVIAKSRELLKLALPLSKAERLIETVLDLESLENVRQLRPLLQP